MCSSSYFYNAVGMSHHTLEHLEMYSFSQENIPTLLLFLVSMSTSDNDTHDFKLSRQVTYTCARMPDAK